MQHLIHLGADVNAYSDLDPKPPRRWLTALQTAAVLQNRMMVRLLLDFGASVGAGAHSDFGMTALQAAASAGDEYVVQMLLDSGANVNTKPALKGGKTALQAAASTGNQSLAQMLIDFGADICAKPAHVHGRTALQAAAESGHTELVRLLIDLGADVNAPPAKENGLCALEAAVHNGSTELVELVLTSRINLQVHGGPATARAIFYGKCAILRLLLFAGVDINDAHTTDAGLDGLSALELALYYDDGLVTSEDKFAMVKLLLNNGANSKSAALALAARHDYLEIAKLLLSSIDADRYDGLKDGDASEALCEAANNTSLEMLRLLLDHGAKGRSRALQAAVLHGNTDVIQLLISSGADVNAAPFDIDPWEEIPRTALQAAARTGRLEIVRFLLDAGALPEINPSPYEEGTALQFAAITGNIDIVYELLQRGAHVNAAARGERGRTALEGAAEHGRLDIVQLLINVQAEVRETRALKFARREGHDGVVGLLLKHLG